MFFFAGVMTISAFVATTPGALSYAASEATWNTCKSDFAPAKDSIAACREIVADKNETAADRARAYYNIGVALGKDYKFDEAIAAYDQAVKLDPGLALAYFNSGNYYRRKMEYDRTLADFDVALRIDPKYVPALDNRGHVKYLRGEYEQSILDFDAALRLDPTSIEVYINRGVSLTALNEFDRAIADFDQTIRLAGNSVALKNIGYGNRGVVHYKKGDYQKAIADFDEALKLDKFDTIAYVTRERAHYYAGRLDQAREDFKEAATRHASNGYYAMWLDIAERESKQKRSIFKAKDRLSGKTVFKGKVTYEKSWPYALVSIYLGEAGEAAAMVQAMHANPWVARRRHCEANFFLGKLALLQGRKDEAKPKLLTAARECLRSSPEQHAASLEIKALGLNP